MCNKPSFTKTERTISSTALEFLSSNLQEEIDAIVTRASQPTCRFCGGDLVNFHAPAFCGECGKLLDPVVETTKCRVLIKCHIVVLERDVDKVIDQTHGIIDANTVAGQQPSDEGC